MVEESIVYSITNGILNLEFYEPTRVTKPEQYYLDKFFSTVENNDKRLHMYIRSIIDSQAKYMINNIELKKDINIPKLGNFKCNTFKQIKIAKKSELETLDLTPEEKRAELNTYLKGKNIKYKKENIYNIVLNNIKVYTHNK